MQKISFFYIFFIFYIFYIFSLLPLFIRQEKRLPYYQMSSGSLGLSYTSFGQSSR